MRDARKIFIVFLSGYRLEGIASQTEQHSLFPVRVQKRECWPGARHRQQLFTQLFFVLAVGKAVLAIGIETKPG
jgi:hypothetical protein